MKALQKIEETLKLSKFNDLEYVKKISKKTKLKPEYVSLIGIVLIAFFFLFTCCGQKLLLIFTSFLYPVYKSFKALETKLDHENKRWLTYWTVFGFIFAFRSITDFILGYFPFYNIFLTAFLFFVYCPLTNGYVYIYDYVFKPCLQSYEKNINGYLQMAQDEINDKLKRAKKTVAEGIIDQ